MSNKAFEVYSQLPPWAKGVALVGGLGLIYVVGKPLYHKIFPSIEEKASKLSVRTAQSDIAKFLANGLTPSFNESQYSQFADVIYNAQAHTIATDGGKIVDTLKFLKNDLDVAKLITVYGTRQNYDFMIPTQNLGLLAAARNGMTHFGYFTYQIDEVMNDWKGKGITYVI